MFQTHCGQVGIEPVRADVVGDVVDDVTPMVGGAAGAIGTRGSPRPHDQP
jgi:hypothetical protein